MPRIAAWSEGTIGEPVITGNGTTTAMRVEKLSENCTPNCGDSEKAQPSTITDSLNTGQTFTDTESITVTGGIQGGTFLIGINAKLEVAASVQNGNITTVGGVTQVTLAACAWQKLYSSLSVTRGKTIECSGTIRPFATFECPHLILAVNGLEQTVTSTISVDKAVVGSGQSGTLSNGTCPPDPPATP